MSPPRRESNPLLRIARSTTALVLLTIVLGAALAAVLGLIVWAIAAALHGASTS